MYASTHQQPVAWSKIFRWGGRVTGVVLFATWVGFVIAEFARPGFFGPIADFTIAQGVALSAVFAGYAVGWIYERAGAWMTLLGTAVYLGIVALGARAVPEPYALLFAAPGILYLMARWYDDSQTKHLASK